jgi:hypothetical protein
MSNTNTDLRKWIDNFVKKFEQNFGRSAYLKYMTENNKPVYTSTGVSETLKDLGNKIDGNINNLVKKKFLTGAFKDLAKYLEPIYDDLNNLDNNENVLILMLFAIGDIVKHSANMNEEKMKDDLAQTILEDPSKNFDNLEQQDKETVIGIIKILNETFETDMNQIYENLSTSTGQDVDDQQFASEMQPSKAMKNSMNTYVIELKKLQQLDAELADKFGSILPRNQNDLEDIYGRLLNENETLTPVSTFFDYMTPTQQTLPIVPPPSNRPVRVPVPQPVARPVPVQQTPQQPPQSGGADNNTPTPIVNQTPTSTPIVTPTPTVNQTPVVTPTSIVNQNQNLPADPQQLNQRKASHGTTLGDLDGPKNRLYTEGTKIPVDANQRPFVNLAFVKKAADGQPVDPVEQMQKLTAVIKQNAKLEDKLILKKSDDKFNAKVEHILRRCFEVETLTVVEYVKVMYFIGIFVFLKRLNSYLYSLITKIYMSLDIAVCDSDDFLAPFDLVSKAMLHLVTQGEGLNKVNRIDELLQMPGTDLQNITMDEATRANYGIDKRLKSTKSSNSNDVGLEISAESDSKQKFGKLMGLSKQAGGADASLTRSKLIPGLELGKKHFNVQMADQLNKTTGMLADQYKGIFEDFEKNLDKTSGLPFVTSEDFGTDEAEQQDKSRQHLQKAMEIFKNNNLETKLKDWSIVPSNSNLSQSGGDAKWLFEQDTESWRDIGNLSDLREYFFRCHITQRIFLIEYEKAMIAGASVLVEFQRYYRLLEVVLVLLALFHIVMCSDKDVKIPPRLLTDVHKLIGMNKSVRDMITQTGKLDGGLGKIEPGNVNVNLSGIMNRLNESRKNSLDDSVLGPKGKEFMKLFRDTEFEPHNITLRFGKNSSAAKEFAKEVDELQKKFNGANDDEAKSDALSKYRIFLDSLIQTNMDKPMGIIYNGPEDFDTAKNEVQKLHSSISSLVSTSKSGGGNGGKLSRKVGIRHIKGSKHRLTSLKQLGGAENNNDEQKDNAPKANDNKQEANENAPEATENAPENNDNKSGNNNNTPKENTKVDNKNSPVIDIQEQGDDLVLRIKFSGSNTTDEKDGKTSLMGGQNKVNFQIEKVTSDGDWNKFNNLPTPPTPLPDDNVKDENDNKANNEPDSEPEKDDNKLVNTTNEWSDYKITDDKTLKIIMEIDNKMKPAYKSFKAKEHGDVFENIDQALVNVFSYEEGLKALNSNSQDIKDALKMSSDALNNYIKLISDNNELKYAFIAKHDTHNYFKYIKLITSDNTGDLNKDIELLANDIKNLNINNLKFKSADNYKIGEQDLYTYMTDINERVLGQARVIVSIRDKLPNYSEETRESASKLAEDKTIAVQSGGSCVKVSCLCNKYNSSMKSDCHGVFRNVFVNPKNETIFNEEFEGGDSRGKLLDSTIMEGGNLIVFGFGFSGSGKTHILLSSSNRNNILNETVKYIRSKKEGVKISVSFEELYPVSKDGEFIIDSYDGIEYTNSANFNTEFSKIESKRKNLLRIAPTPNNDVSSRSHMFIVVSFNLGKDEKDNDIIGKLTLVDMAGAENTIEIKKQFLVSKDFNLSTRLKLKTSNKETLKHSSPDTFGSITYETAENKKYKFITFHKSNLSYLSINKKIYFAYTSLYTNKFNLMEKLYVDIAKNGDIKVVSIKEEYNKQFGNELATNIAEKYGHFVNAKTKMTNDDIYRAYFYLTYFEIMFIMNNKKFQTDDLTQFFPVNERMYAPNSDDMKVVIDTFINNENIKKTYIKNEKDEPYLYDSLDNVKEHMKKLINKLHIEGECSKKMVDNLDYLGTELRYNKSQKIFENKDTTSIKSPFILLYFLIKTHFESLNKYNPQLYNLILTKVILSYVNLIVKQGNGIVTTLEHLKYTFLYNTGSRVGLINYNKNNPKEKRFTNKLANESQPYTRNRDGMTETVEMGKMKQSKMIDQLIKYSAGGTPMNWNDITEPKLDGVDIIKLPKPIKAKFVMITAIIRGVLDDKLQYVEPDTNFPKYCSALDDTLNFAKSITSGIGECSECVNNACAKPSSGGGNRGKNRKTKRRGYRGGKRSLRRKIRRSRK